jgi:hypothetical protein
VGDDDPACLIQSNFIADKKRGNFKKYTRKKKSHNVSPYRACCKILQ